MLLVEPHGHALNTTCLLSLLLLFLYLQDLLSAFDGSWHIEPLDAPCGKQGTKAVMIQDVSPKGENESVIFEAI